MHRFLKIFIFVFSFQLGDLSVQAKTCEGQAAAFSNPFHFAYENLKSFDYLNYAVNFLKSQHPQGVICFSAAVLTQNSLSYNEYIFQIEIAKDANAEPYNRISVLFQDGPIQAYHNALGLPWIGLENTKVNTLLSQVVQSGEAKVYPRLGSLPLELVQQTSLYQFRKDQIVPETLNAIEFRGPDTKAKYYLVTWLKNKHYGYIKDMILAEGSILILDSSDKFKVIEDVPLFSDVLANLRQINTESKPSITELNVWVQQLIKFSYVY